MSLPSTSPATPGDEHPAYGLVDSLHDMLQSLRASTPSADSTVWSEKYAALEARIDECLEALRATPSPAQQAMGAKARALALANDPRVRALADDTTHLRGLVYVNDLVWALSILAGTAAATSTDARMLEAPGSAQNLRRALVIANHVDVRALAADSTRLSGRICVGDLVWALGTLAALISVGGNAPALLG